MGMYYSRMNDFLLSPAGAAVMMSAVLFGLGLISVFWSRRRREYRRSNENDWNAGWRITSKAFLPGTARRLLHKAGKPTQVPILPLPLLRHQNDRFQPAFRLRREC
jgi:hypothetical protein